MFDKSHSYTTTREYVKTYPQKTYMYIISLSVSGSFIWKANTDVVALVYVTEREFAYTSSNMEDPTRFRCSMLYILLLLSL